MSVNDDAFVKEKTVRALTERMIGAVNALEFDPSMVGAATDAALSALASAGAANTDRAATEAARDEAAQAVQDLFTPVTLDAGPPAPPEMSRPTWVSSFQSGHGWTEQFGGSTLTAETEDFWAGTQALRVTHSSGASAIQKNGLGLDLTGKALAIWVKIDSLPAGTNFYVYAAEDPVLAKSKVWTIRRGTEPSPQVQFGDWAVYLLPWETGGGATNPNRASIGTVRIRCSGTAGDYTVQAVGTVPAPPTRRATISFTCDDGWDTQMDMARVLAARGIAGTAYIIPEIIGTSTKLTVDQVRVLRDRYRWDIQAHGLTTYTQLSEQELRDEWKATRNWFATHGLGRPDHLAYVGGQSNPLVVEVAREFFTSARTVSHHFPVVWPPSEPHRHQGLSGISGAAGGTSVAVTKAAIDAAVAGGHHLSLVFHIITQGAASNALDCSVADLGEIADYAVASGADILTVAEVFRRG